MRNLREWIARLAGTLRGVRRDDDLEQELRLHVELAAEDARRRARRRSMRRAARVSTPAVSRRRWTRCAINAAFPGWTRWPATSCSAGGS